MKWNRRPELEGKHSFLSASKYHWVNYDDTKLLETFDKSMDAALGTRLHALASELIRLGIPLPNTGQTLNLYVNDCISYRMKTEQALYYSMNAFGTADAISFGPNHLNPSGPFILRIFDLKNGVTPASATQLVVYAAYFCLEYKVRPLEIEYDLRLYQNDAIRAPEIDPDDVMYVMSKITEFDKVLNKAREEANI